MPNPVGRDRVERLPNGDFEIHSALDKGWRGRRDRTNTTPEFPGTPVRWDEQWFEVVLVKRLADGRRTYVLSPWPAHHLTRNPARYDQASERALAAEVERRAKNQKSSRGIAVAGLIIGHIPGHAQREVEREYGFSSIALSLISLILPILFAAWTATRLPVQGLPPPHASPPQVGIAIMLFCESMLRLMLVLRLSSPMGSVIGLIGYELWRLTTGSGRAFDARAAVKAEQRLSSRSIGQADAATIERDTYELRLPFLALLSPQEQLRLRKVFGFDPRMWGIRTALVLGSFTALGVWTSIMTILRGGGTFSSWSSLFLASILFVEQLRRMMVILGGKPAGSVLGVFVRPWCRKLLAMEPAALKEGTVKDAPVHMPDVWDGDVPDDHKGL